MEIEVMIPSPPPEFNFDSACTSPYMTAPSSPQRFGNFFLSAPTSPTRAASLLREYSFAAADGGISTINPTMIPFYWEEKPGTPKRRNAHYDDEFNDFEFNFSGSLSRASISDADELFSGGKIKPLKPPPAGNSPKSPRSPAKTLIGALSPKHKRKDLDPFEEAIKQSRRDRNTGEQERERGRERNCTPSSSNRREKGTRSLSPFRDFNIISENETNQPNSNPNPNYKTKNSLFSFSFSNWKTPKKWKLKDLFLFRSASEGRSVRSQTILSDSMKNYAVSKRNYEEDAKNSSFRSTESSGSVSGLRRKGSISAHEIHYTANRAVQEEMKKKTSLPYKHGLMGMGCLGFEPAVHDLARNFGSMSSR